MCVICIFSSIDLWILSSSNQLSWLKLQHFIFCFFPPFTLWYLMVLVKKENITFLKLYFLSAIILSSITIWGIIFDKTTQNFSTLYYYIYLPYVIFSVLYLNIFIIKKLKSSKIPEKKILFFHLIGFIFLGFTGICDIIHLSLLDSAIPVTSISSFTIFGVVALCILLVYLFTERLILLIKEKETSHQKLKLAYKELEQSHSLSELGKSSAIISHEIKNYACAIIGYIQLAENKRDLPKITKTLLGKASKSVENLSTFSNDILDFSKSKILKDKISLNIGERIKHTISYHFNDRKNNFKLIDFDEETIIHGDWEKLDHVFFNIFKNAFEAEATEIAIKLIHTNPVLLITIEDNGIGIAEEDPKTIFQAFYTTKSRQEGSGLGMAITRSIVEGHGGYVNVTSKNQQRNKGHGLIFNISFPSYAESVQQAQNKNDHIVLIKEGLGELISVINTFRNVYVNPHIIQDFSEFDIVKYPYSKVTILGNPAIIGEINKKHQAYECFSIVSSHDKNLYVVGNKENSYNGLFSEEFILSKLRVS